MTGDKPCEKKAQDVVEADTWCEYLMEDCRLGNSLQPMSMSQLLNQDWSGASLSTGSLQCGTSERVHEVPNLNEVGHDIDEATMVEQNAQVTGASMDQDGDQISTRASDLMDE